LAVLATGGEDADGQRSENTASHATPREPSSRRIGRLQFAS